MDFTRDQLIALALISAGSIISHLIAYYTGRLPGFRAGYNKGVADSDKHATERHATERAHYFAERQALQNKLNYEKAQRQIGEHRLRQDLAQAMEAADKRIEALQAGQLTEQDARRLAAFSATLNLAATTFGSLGSFDKAKRAQAQSAEAIALAERYQPAPLELSA